MNRETVVNCQCHLGGGCGLASEKTSSISKVANSISTQSSENVLVESCCLSIEVPPICGGMLIERPALILSPVLARQGNPETLLSRPES